MAPECDNCGKDLNVSPVERPEVDWMKVQCSECNRINTVSLIRLSAGTRPEK
ncbi:MAG: hypothetical protein ABEJ93_01120 [Candidatus Nanohalobium sp.]